MKLLSVDGRHTGDNKRPNTKSSRILPSASGSCVNSLPSVCAYSCRAVAYRRCTLIFLAQPCWTGQQKGRCPRSFQESSGLVLAKLAKWWYARNPAQFRAVTKDGAEVGRGGLFSLVRQARGLSLLVAQRESRSCGVPALLCGNLWSFQKGLSMGVSDQILLVFVHKFTRCSAASGF
jgi:hypothetical protein